jgi:hypothetical protein
MNEKNKALIEKLLLHMRVAVGDLPEPKDEGDEVKRVKQLKYFPVRDENGRFAAGKGEWKEVEVDIPIENINKELRRRKDCQPNYLVYWAAINEQGHVHHDTYAICHANLTRPGVPNPKFIINRLQFESRTKKGHADREILEAYMEYLSYRSPYRTAFAVKGGKRIIDEGYAVFNCNIPGNLMGAAMLCTRMMWEYPAIPVIWYELVKNGAHPDIAYLHAYQVTSVDMKTLSIKGLCTHTPLNGNAFTQDCALNFINHKPVNALDKPYNKHHYYRPMHSLFGYHDPHYYENKSYLSDRLNDIKKLATGKAAAKNINPFARANGDKNVVPIDAFCKHWAPVLIEEYAKLMANADAENERKAA